MTPDNIDNLIIVSLWLGIGFLVLAYILISKWIEKKYK